MKIITIKRTHILPGGLYGTLDIDGEPFCQTYEQPKPHVKEGEYLCRRALSPKRQVDVYWLQDVPGMTDVQIHWGNTDLDTDGCILVGRAFGQVETLTQGILLGVQESGHTFRRFMAMLQNDPEIKLVIVNRT